MGLFFDVLSAINNPNQQGSVSQLESITGALQQVSSSQGIPPGALQSVVSQLGPLLLPALKQQGAGGLGSVLSQLGAAGGTATALQALFPPAAQQQFAQVISQKTGISSTVILSALPVVIPAVLSLLNMGSGKPGTTVDNPLLSSFLDGNGDGSTDLGDVFKFANRFLNPA